MFVSRLRFNGASTLTFYFQWEYALVSPPSHWMLFKWQAYSNGDNQKSEHNTSMTTEFESGEGDRETNTLPSQPSRDHFVFNIRHRITLSWIRLHCWTIVRVNIPNELLVTRLVVESLKRKWWTLQYTVFIFLFVYCVICWNNQEALSLLRNTI